MRMREDWRPRLHRTIKIDRLLAELNAEKYERHESLKNGETVAETDFAAGAVYGLNFALAALKREVLRVEDELAEIEKNTREAEKRLAETAAYTVTESEPAEAEKAAALCEAPCEYECGICCRDCADRKTCGEACDGFDEDGVYAPCPWRKEA